MTALTAGYLVNEPFKNNNSHSTPVVNGIKPKENGERNKLEFVDGGILKPPALPTNAIRLKPESQSKTTPSIPSSPLTVSPSPNNLSNGKINISSPSRGIKRKRLLSDRFEREAQYPVIEPTVASLTSWEGCDKVGTNGALAGIRNPHNNCFLNSVLQAICHIPQFGRFILEKHQNNGQHCKIFGALYICTNYLF